MYRNVTQFANLTPLRFIAAYLVVVFHVEETRKMFGVANLTEYSFFTNGPLAVSFFFVLSGFLITYLLLREHDQNGRVAVGRFYVRRMLRIWPLYFLMVFIGLVLIPAAMKLDDIPFEPPYQSSDVALYFLLFLPFVVNLTYGNHFLTPLWSVGVEEMYYLGWAPLVKWLRKHLLLILLSTVVIKATLAVIAHYIWKSTLAAEVLRMLQFEAMAIGGLAAYFVFTRSEPVASHWLFSRTAQLVLMLPLFARLFIHNSAIAYSPVYAAVMNHAVLTPLLLMALFAWFIVNASVNERTLIRLNSRWLNYLGDVSYGIYMYHALVISLLFVPLIDDYQKLPAPVATLLLHAVVAIVTLLFAALSKRYFEDRFLRHKHRFNANTQQASASPTSATTAAAKPLAA